MSQEELVTKVTQIIERKDGSQVKIVASLMFGSGLHSSIDTYVHRRDSEEHEWVLCGDKPHPDWRKMSIDDYIKNGRSEMLKAVSPGEILKARSQLGKPMKP